MQSGASSIRTFASFRSISPTVDDSRNVITVNDQKKETSLGHNLERHYFLQKMKNMDEKASEVAVPLSAANLCALNGANFFAVYFVTYLHQQNDFRLQIGKGNQKGKTDYLAGSMQTASNQGNREIRYGVSHGHGMGKLQGNCCVLMRQRTFVVGGGFEERELVTESGDNPYPPSPSPLLSAGAPRVVGGCFWRLRNPEATGRARVRDAQLVYSYMNSPAKQPFKWLMRSKNRWNQRET